MIKRENIGPGPAAEIVRSAPSWVQAHVRINGENVLYVYPEYLIEFLFLCRDHLHSQIKLCVDICCIDYPLRNKRFSLVYNLCSVHKEKARKQWSKWVDRFFAKAIVKPPITPQNYVEALSCSQCLTGRGDTTPRQRRRRPKKTPCDQLGILISCQWRIIK